MLDLICENTPFCISREYAPASEVGGLVRKVDAEGQPVSAAPAAVRALGVRIQFVANDNLGNIPAGNLRQTCVPNACVVFRMSCERLTCSWQAAPVPKTGPIQLQEVRLAASSAEALTRAKLNVFLSTSNASEPIAISRLGSGQPAPPGAYFGALQSEDVARRHRD